MPSICLFTEMCQNLFNFTFSFIGCLMLNRVYLGVNYWNDVVFGATIGGVLAHVGNYWYYPYVLNYSEKRL